MFKDSIFLTISHLLQLVVQFLIIRLLTYNYSVEFYAGYLIVVGVGTISSKMLAYPYNQYLQVEYSKSCIKNPSLYISLASFILSIFITFILLTFFESLSFDSFLFAISFFIIDYGKGNYFSKLNSLQFNVKMSKLNTLFNLLKISSYLVILDFVGVNESNIYWCLFIFNLILSFIFYVLMANDKNLNKKVKKSNFWTTSNKELKDYLNFSLPLVLIGLLSYLTISSDRYFLTYFFNDKIVATYSTLYLIASKPFVFSKGIIDSLLRPKLFKNFNTRNSLFILKKWALISSGITIMVLFINIFYRNIYTVVMPSEYFLYGHVLIPISIGFFPYLMCLYFQRILMKVHKNSLILIGDLIAALFTLTLYLICGLYDNWLCFAYVPLIAFSLKLIFLIFFVCRNELMKPKEIDY